MTKKSIILVIAVLTGLLVFASYAAAISTPYIGQDSSTAGIGINGSVHDMTSLNSSANTIYNSAMVDTGLEDPLVRICIYCHAPHNTYRLPGSPGGTGEEVSDARYTYLPLWNHKITTLQFDPYSNGAGPLTGPKHAQSTDVGTFIEIGNVSLLCLSCHDGSVGVNEFGVLPQPDSSRSSGGQNIDDAYQIGAAYNATRGNLQNHHPIGFIYANVVTDDNEIQAAASASFGTSSVADHLFAGRMECATCHAVHNKGNTGEKLLWKSDFNSEFCTTCHLKAVI